MLLYTYTPLYFRGVPFTPQHLFDTFSYELLCRFRLMIKIKVKYNPQSNDEYYYR